MDRQTLRDWVIRFNEQGADGLVNIPSPGVPPKLDAAHRAFLARIVDEGPIPAAHGVRFAAQYSARGLPCERFTAALADRISCITRGRGGWLNLPRGGLSPPIFASLSWRTQLRVNCARSTTRRHVRMRSDRVHYSVIRSRWRSQISTRFEDAPFTLCASSCRCTAGPRPRSPGWLRGICRPV
jgi:hypothetical protein